MSAAPAILLVDDQKANLQVRTLLLRQFGCQVITVETKDAAERAVCSDVVDLAILDYHLAGGILGDEVARSLRVLRPGIRVVMLTGDPKIPDAAQRSVDATLIKGSGGPGELWETIHRLLPEKTLAPRRPMLISVPPRAS